MSDSEKKDSFIGQKVRRPRRCGGGRTDRHFILAIAIFAAIFMIVGKQTTSARVDAVQAGSAAATAGFQPGDLVLSINGEKIDSFADMQRIVSVSSGEPLKIRSSVRTKNSRSRPRRSSRKSKTISAMSTGWRAWHQPFNGGRRHQDRETRAVRRGRAGRARDLVRSRPHAVLLHSRRFRRAEAADQLGGPIRIDQVSGQVASAGFVALIHLTAVLSVLDRSF